MATGDYFNWNLVGTTALQGGAPAYYTGTTVTTSGDWSYSGTTSTIGWSPVGVATGVAPIYPLPEQATPGSMEAKAKKPVAKPGKASRTRRPPLSRVGDGRRWRDLF